MHYLFGFSGRINRAKMWLFILVTLGWHVVIGLVAAFGLTWTRVIAHSARLTTVGPRGGTSVSAVIGYPHLDAIDSPLNWIAVGLIAVLVLAWFLALFAVTTKRLHDRGKGAIWLIPFVVIPWGIHLAGIVLAFSMLAFGMLPVPYIMGLGAVRFAAFVLGVWAFIELFCLSGTPGSNQYGPDPLVK